MKRTLIALFVVALALCATVAHAQDIPAPSPAVRAEVAELLGSFEYQPSQKDWDRIGPDAAPVLLDIARDPKQQPTVRSRAISSLVHVQGDHQAFLVEVLGNGADYPTLVRRKAMNVIALKYPEAAITALGRFVDHEDTHMRESAIRALGLVNKPEARALLEERLKIETKVYLKDEIKASLGKIDVPAP